MRVGGQCQAPATLPPGKARYPLCRRLSWPQGWSREVQKISPPLGFDPQTIQPAASQYTNYAILAHSQIWEYSNKIKLFVQNATQAADIIQMQYTQNVRQQTEL
jgi:hypothetical protein